MKTGGRLGSGSNEDNQLVGIAQTQWLTSGEWACPLDSDPKLAVEQPNSS